tara:strand:+ start:269 stop:469 length:201 start_codon:yes stop_codon:yes gene_type:complete
MEGWERDAHIAESNRYDDEILERIDVLETQIEKYESRLEYLASERVIIEREMRIAKVTIDILKEHE